MLTSPSISPWTHRTQWKPSLPAVACDQEARAKWADGFGIGRPILSASSIQAKIASSMARAASSRVSPSDMHPGKSGTVARKPPPSSFDSASIMMGYSRPTIRVSDVLNETDQFANIDRLDGPAKWYG